MGLFSSDPFSRTSSARHGDSQWTSSGSVFSRSLDFRRPQLIRCRRRTVTSSRQRGDCAGSSIVICSSKVCAVDNSARRQRCWAIGPEVPQMGTPQVSTIRRYLNQHRSQVQILGVEGQRLLARKRVHVAGLGRLGTAVLFDLVSSGFVEITANDPQDVDHENLGAHLWARPSDVGRPKAWALERYIQGRRPEIAFVPRRARSEDGSIDDQVAQADIVIIASNTAVSRRAMERKAINANAISISAGIVDGRERLAGVVSVRDPRHAWHACAGCHLPNEFKLPRGEGLLYPVVAMVASHVAQLVVQLVTGHEIDQLAGCNYWLLDGASHSVHSLGIQKRPDCEVCCREEESKVAP